MGADSGESHQGILAGSDYEKGLLAVSYKTSFTYFEGIEGTDLDEPRPQTVPGLSRLYKRSDHPSKSESPKG